MDYDLVLWEQRLATEESERLSGYATRWKYYNGDHPRMLKVKTGQADDNVMINLARLIVDKGAAFLFGKELVFELQEGEKTPEEDKLETIWQANRMMTFLGKLAVTGGVCGHVFIKIIPDGVSYAGEKMPRLVNVDPAYVTAAWSPDDVEDVWLYRTSWTGQDERGRAIHRREDIQRVDQKWIVTNYAATGHGAWAQQGEPLNWPYDWPPMIACQNIPYPHAFYGLSDLEDLSLQNAINFTASNILRILRYHAHPKTWGRGFHAKDVEVGPDEVFIIPSLEGNLQNLEMQSDLSSSQAYLNTLINRFLATGRVPRIDPTEVSVGALSGFALRILYSDLLEKNEMKRRTYGDMLIELNRRLLEMTGMGDQNICTIHWSDPLPADPNADTVRDKFELDYNLTSLETVRVRRGLDNEAEEERIAAQEVNSGNIGAALLRNFETQREGGNVPSERGIQQGA